MWPPFCSSLLARQQGAIYFFQMKCFAYWHISLKLGGTCAGNTGNEHFTGLHIQNLLLGVQQIKRCWLTAVITVTATVLKCICFHFDVGRVEIRCVHQPHRQWQSLNTRPAAGRSVRAISSTNWLLRWHSLIGSLCRPLRVKGLLFPPRRGHIDFTPAMFEPVKCTLQRLTPFCLGLLWNWQYHSQIEQCTK